MKKNLKIIFVFLFTICTGLMVNEYVQPSLVNTKWDFIPLSYLLVIPATYYIATIQGFAANSNLRRLLVSTLTMMCCAFLLNLPDWNDILGKLLAYLISAVLILLSILTTKNKATKYKETGN